MAVWHNLRWAFKRHRPFLLELMVALCLAFLIWLYTHSRAQATVDHVVLPVVVQLAPTQQDQFELEVQGPRQVHVSFAGPSSRVRELRKQLQRGVLKATLTCSIPDERQKLTRFTDKLVVEPTHIQVPPGITTVIAEDTNVIPVTFHRIIERELPVRLDHSGDVRVRPLSLEPATVVVRGPKEILERVRALPTQPYAFALKGDGTSEEDVTCGQVPLVTELEGRLIQTRPEKINFTCRVQPRQRVYELTDLPVHFLCPANSPWRPRYLPDQSGKVVVRILGPVVDELPPVTAFVDLTAGSQFGKGRNSSAVRIQLPKEFQLVPDGTPIVSFFLDEAAELDVK